MKQLLTVLAIIFATFFIFNNQIIPRGEFAEAVERATLPLKTARLAALEPETKILMPVTGVRVQRIANTWQAPRAAGERLHEGQDIFAPRGTAIFSATTGYIIKIGENPLGGNVVFVVGAGSRFYYYAHLDKFAPELKIGDYVTPETVLGYVGNTGNARSTPPHLHFGVYTANGAINPLPLLADRS